MIYKYTSSFYCHSVLPTITPIKLSNEIYIKLAQFLQQQCGMHEIKQVTSGYLVLRLVFYTVNGQPFTQIYTFLFSWCLQIFK